MIDEKSSVLKTFITDQLSFIKIRGNGGNGRHT